MKGQFEVTFMTKKKKWLNSASFIYIYVNIRAEVDLIEDLDEYIVSLGTSMHDGTLVSYFSHHFQAKVQ